MSPRDADRATIRVARAEDARAYLHLLLRLDAETDTLLLEAGERGESEGAVASRLERALDTGDDLYLVAGHRGTLVGFLEANGGRARRNRHVAYLALGVRPAHQGRGVGTGLLARAEQWARASARTRLELTVMTHNERAVRLYERAGFDREGVRRHALVIRGAPVDEYYMGKLI